MKTNNIWEYKMLFWCLKTHRRLEKVLQKPVYGATKADNRKRAVYAVVSGFSRAGIYLLS